MKNIVKKYELIFTEIDTNNNKFWRGILFDDGTGQSEWGRVGYDANITPYPSHSVVESKMRGKLKKGYTQLQLASSSGAESKSTVVAKSNLHEIARKQIIKNNTSPTLVKLIDRLIKSNVHQITSSTKITYNDATGLFQTPLGIVTQQAIDDARGYLGDIFTYIKGSDYKNPSLSSLVSKYLRLIPQDVGMKLRIESLFPDVKSIQNQQNTLDSLEASLQALTSTPAKSSDNKNEPEEKVFEVDLDVLNDFKEADRLVKWYESSKRKMHGYDNVKVVNIYSVNIKSMTDRFNEKLGNLTEVWHGTSEANLLSILKVGLKIHPPSTAAIAGALFGVGCYGAIHSSKSLGYTYGRWGQGGVGSSGWLFCCDFSMGKTYTTTTYGCTRPSGYDSIWAKSSPGGLHHDELIVPKESQVKIKYLLECK